MTAPQLLVLAASPAGKGGIQRLTQEVTLVANQLLGSGGVAVLELEADGGRDLSALTTWGRLSTKVGYASGAFRTIRKPPKAILCLHVGLAPLARVLAHHSRARYAVACYGLEVWGALPRAETWGLRGAQEVWSISDFTSKQVLGQGVEASRIRLWSLGLPPSVTVTAATRSTSPMSARVLSVARLTKRNAYKGVDALIASWPAVKRSVPHAELTIVGDGDMRPGLERLAVLLGVTDSVRFLGGIDDQQLNEEYARADLFALPGRTSVTGMAEGEGFGIVFLEAAAAGLPTIGGRSGGTPEAVLDQETGLLVNPHEPTEIAKAITRLLTDLPLAEKLGTRGAEMVQTDRSTVRSRQHLGELLTDLMAGV